MDLPPALAPWGPQLQIFPLQVALSLGPLVQRLSAAIGPLRDRFEEGDGEVDGFDGLARRGSYDRLLVSEWLLAEEAPEEFLRRASVGEHTFLRLSRPEPRGVRSSVALFDSGPSQLGSPRIAQLAALIVLARRAQAAGAPFAWGVLQDPQAPLATEWDQETVLRLVRSRTALAATESHGKQWSERLGGWNEGDDAWIVGSPGSLAAALGSLPPALRGASRLEVVDPLQPGERRVAVAVRRRGKAARELALDLPQPEACVRLLRAPFEVAAVSSRPSLSLRPEAGLLFSSSGRHLLARAEEGGLLAWPVPNSPGHPLGPVAHRFREVPAASLVAAEVTKRSSFALVQLPDGLALLDDDSGRLGDVLLAPEPESTPEGPGPRFEGGSEPGPRPLYRFQERFFVLDTEACLFRLPNFPQPSHAELVCRGVLALRPVRDGIAVVARDQWGLVSFQLVPRIGAPQDSSTLPALQGEEAFFAAGVSSLVSEPFGAVAVRSGDEWRLFHPRETRLRALSGSRAIGAVLDPRHGEVGLLLLDDDRRSLGVAGKSWSRPLLKASSEIEWFAVCSRMGRIAYRTQGGEVAIAALKTGQFLARWLPEAL